MATTIEVLKSDGKCYKNCPQLFDYMKCKKYGQLENDVLDTGKYYINQGIKSSKQCNIDYGKTYTNQTVEVSNFKNILDNILNG